MITETQRAFFLQFIDSYDAFLVAGHKEPDGDCIASCVALASLLEAKNKRVLMLSSGPFKRPEVKKYEHLFKKEPVNGRWFDDSCSENAKIGLFIVDCSSIDRLGGIGDFLSQYPLFVIDHHKTSRCDEQFSIIDMSSPATAFILQQLYEAEMPQFSPEIAKVLFFGLATDTGYFRFLNNSGAEVFNAAARLVQRGANPHDTYEFMTGGKPFMGRKLLGELLERTEQYFGGKLLATFETLDDSQRYGLGNRDSDALYQLLLSVENVCAVVIARQESDTLCTVGLRSCGDVDVSAIAARFGGGGHKNASGLSVEGTLDLVLPKIIQEFADIL